MRCTCERTAQDVWCPVHKHPERRGILGIISQNIHTVGGEFTEEKFYEALDAVKRHDEKLQREREQRSVMGDIERDVEDFIECWAHDYANEDWRALSGADQIRVARAMMEKALELANHQGAVDVLREIAEHEPTADSALDAHAMRIAARSVLAELGGR